MGIKNFSKVFKHTRDIKIRDMHKQKVAVDAMTELYRASLGATSTHTLTDKYGKPTIHITVILSNIIEMQKYGVEPIWVFDYDQDTDGNEQFHNPAKLGELLKRKKRKAENQARLDKLNASRVKTREEELFSDTDEEDEKDTKPPCEALTANQLTKRVFRVPITMINDVKLILNCLNIKYVEAPCGFEGEQVASKLSAIKMVDAVYSGDTDPIPFGALKLYRKNTRDKKIYVYEQDDILEQMKKAVDKDSNATIKDLRKLCVILGCDFAPKTAGVGVKRIFKVFNRTELTEEQKTNGVGTFEKNVPVDNLIIHNKDKIPFVDCKFNELMEWLVNERSFNRASQVKRFEKILDFKTNPPVPLPIQTPRKTKKRISTPEPEIQNNTK